VKCRIKKDLLKYVTFIVDLCSIKTIYLDAYHIMNSNSITLFYDVLSVHSWVLFHRLSSIQSLIPDSVLKLRFWPVHGANLLTTTGNFIPWLTPPLKKMYFEDIRLLAAVHRIPLKTPYMQIDEILLASSSSARPQMLLHWIGNDKGIELQIQASNLLWRRLWVENNTIHEDSDLLEVLKGLGFSSSKAKDELAEFIRSFDHWGAMLRVAQDKALAANAFGLPWTVINSLEPERIQTSYFGCDRWPLIRKRLLEITATELKPMEQDRIEEVCAIKQFGFAF